MCKSHGESCQRCIECENHKNNENPDGCLGSMRECLKSDVFLDQVSEKQLKEIRHALGLNYGKTPYRNYFYCDANDKDWNDLVKKGFATKHDGQPGTNRAYFILTYEATKLICGEHISEKHYKDL